MRLFITIFTFFTTVAVFAQDAAVLETPVDGPSIKFEESKYEFGDIKQGDVVEHVFAFSNTGNAPLILQDVKTTCGCTVPVWPKEPILPGKSSSITVKFNSRGKIGVQNKVITIISNATDQRSRVMITTNVTLEKTEG